MSLILITGMPGVGKTTIVRKLAADLQARKIPFDGFYTEELRNAAAGERSGFDIVSFDDGKRRAPLARVGNCANEAPGSSSAQNRVGKYTVCVAQFESVALPALSNRSTNLLLLDEIGKMELKSRMFEERLNKIIDEVTRGRLRFVTTIPLKATLGIVERLKRTKNAILFHVTVANRNQMQQDILEATLRMLDRQV